jgi:hypothetical protein
VPIRSRGCEKTPQFAPSAVAGGDTPGVTIEPANDAGPIWPSGDEDFQRLDERVTSCPVGNVQRAVRCLSYREREPDRLQVRVAIRPSLEGVCDASADEDEETVRVRVYLCYPEGSLEPPDPEYMNCPVHIYLDKPLGDRKVVDALTGETLTVFVPNWE